MSMQALAPVATLPVFVPARPAAEEARRAANYPLARWYLRPLAARLAARLAPTRARPWHLTLCGLAASLAAMLVLWWNPYAAMLPAGLVLAAWFFDRADGLLARRQGTASAWGAWLDANVDELADVGLHLAVAAAAAVRVQAAWPWSLLIAFLAGKYLLMYGLQAEETKVAGTLRLPSACNNDSAPRFQADGTPTNAARRCPVPAALRALYHLPGNADVRIHLLAIALACGWLAAELGFVAVYYNLRWIVRYALVVRRLGGAA